MIKSGIYVIRLIGTERCYVGSARVVAHRMARHKVALRDGVHHSSKLQRAWRKHGEEAFIFEFVERVEDVTLLLEREQFWIDGLKASTVGFNILPKAGSHLGAIRPPETGQRISASKKGVRHTEATKQKISQALKGKTPSEETRDNLSASRAGRVISDQARKNISAALTGRRLPPEVIAKISATKRGRPQTPEHRAKVSEALKGKPKTAEHSAKVSVAVKAYNAAAKQRGEGKFSPEAKLRMSQLQKERGFPQSVIDAARERAKVVLHSPEARAKAAESNRGKKRSEEFRRAASERMTGTKASDEARAKMAESARKRWAAKKVQACEEGHGAAD